jgi:hypothetical protein
METLLSQLDRGVASAGSPAPYRAVAFLTVQEHSDSGESFGSIDAEAGLQTGHHAAGMRG